MLEGFGEMAAEDVVVQNGANSAVGKVRGKDDTESIPSPLNLPALTSRSIRSS